MELAHRPDRDGGCDQHKNLTDDVRSLRTDQVARKLGLVGLFGVSNEPVGLLACRFSTNVDRELTAIKLPR